MLVKLAHGGIVAVHGLPFLTAAVPPQPITPRFSLLKWPEKAPGFPPFQKLPQCTAVSRYSSGAVVAQHHPAL